MPFAAGLEPFLALRGKKVVLLASGDPFWFGAGTSITQHLQPEEWRALPGLSSFSLAAAALGWPLETTHCLGLHAAPLERLRPHLGLNKRLLITLKDGAMAQKVAQYLCKVGFEASELHVLERLAGPHQKIRSTRADGFNLENMNTLPCWQSCQAMGRRFRWQMDGQIAPFPMMAKSPNARFAP